MKFSVTEDSFSLRARVGVAFGIFSGSSFRKAIASDMVQCAYYCGYYCEYFSM